MKLILVTLSKIIDRKNGMSQQSIDDLLKINL